MYLACSGSALEATNVGGNNCDELAKLRGLRMQPRRLYIQYGRLTSEYVRPTNTLGKKNLILLNMKDKK